MSRSSAPGKGKGKDKDNCTKDQSYYLSVKMRKKQAAMRVKRILEHC